MAEVQSDSDIEEVSLMEPENQHHSLKGVNLTECDPTLISTLVQEHCMFCLVKKSRTLFSINSKSPIQIDGYELLRRYFGIKTADCLNDVFDATVFKNKVLISSEFPATLLCDSCISIIRDLDVLHKKLELVQRQILARVREVRKLIVDNSNSGDTQEEPSDNRLDFEASMLERCDNDKDKVEMMVSILDKIQQVLQEETDDLIEIHLEHLEKVDPFPADEEDRVEEYYAKLFPAQETLTKSTQTDEDSFTFRNRKYNVQIVHEVEGQDDLTSSSTASSDDDDFNHDFDDHKLGSPPEIAETMEVEDVKHEVTPSIDQPLEPPIESQVVALEPVILEETPVLRESETPPTSLQTEHLQIPPTSPLNEHPEIPPNSPQTEHLQIPPTLPLNEHLQIPPTSPQTENLQIPPALLLNEHPQIPPTSSQTEHLQKNPPTPQPKMKQSGNGITIIRRGATGSPGITIVRNNKTNRRRVKMETESDSEDCDNSESGSCSDSEDSAEDDDESENSNSGEESAASKREQERTKSRPKQFKCRHCSTMFSKRYEAYCHMRTIHKIEERELQTIKLQLSCSECDYDCEKLSELRRHLKEIHNKEASKRINPCVYECDTCGFSKPRIRFAKFLNHLRQHESLVKIIECEDCLQKFTSRQMYQLHPCPQAGRLPGSVNFQTVCFDAIRKETEFKCRICDPSVLSDSEKSLQIHFEIHHRDLQPFSCGICDGNVGFKFKIDLKNHMVQTHDANKFKCRICIKNKHVFKTYNDLHMHMNYEHFGSYFTCPYDCFKQFVSRKKLEDHLKIHMNKERFICDKCEKAFVDERRLLRHKSSSECSERKPPPSRKRYSCTFCDYTCSNTGTHRYHIQQVHGIMEGRKVNSRTYTCEICGFTNSTCTIFSFLDHLRTHENRKTKNFHCEDCMDSFSTKQLYQVHMCPQTGKLPGTATVNTAGILTKKIHAEYVCWVCNDKFTGDRHLQTHTSKEHNVNAFACEICGDIETFKSPHDLKTHMINNHKAVPYKCRRCLPVKIFPKYSQICSHITMEHLGNNYKCPQCDKKFRIRVGLENHLASHSNERKFICTYCGKSQKTISALRGHVRAFHTEGVKMHMCEYCSKEFRDKSNLRKHVQKLHLQQETETKDPNPRRSPRKRRRIDNE